MVENYEDFGINYWMADTTSTPNVFDPANLVAQGGASTGTYKNHDQNWENAIYATEPD